MSQIKFLIVLAIISLTFSAAMQMSFNINGTNCDNKLFNTGDYMTEHGRMSRGINFISDSLASIQSKREPRLFSFEKGDQDVNIQMEFGVPFITIPTKQTIDGLRSFIYDAMQGEIPRPQFNKHALALIGLMCMTLSGVGIMMDQFNYKQYVQGNAPFFFLNRNFASRQDTADDNFSDKINIWQILDRFDKTLASYNIDTTACVQHSICVRVQESLDRISKNEQNPSSLDIILEGITRTDWIMKFISGTAIEDAIRTGRSKKSCDKVYSTCTVNLQFFYSGLQNIKNFV